MNPSPQSKRAAWLYLVAGAIISAVALPLDQAAGRASSVAGNEGLTWLATFCSKLGEGWVVAVTGLLATLFFVVCKRPRPAANVFFIALTASMTGLAGLILRILIGRTRPSASVAQGFYGIWHGGQWIMGKVEFSSFPSGHVATAAGLAAAVWLVNRRWGLLASVYALAVMWSRVALRWHHLSDVTAAVTVGVVGALLMKEYFAAGIDKIFMGPAAPAPAPASASAPASVPRSAGAAGLAGDPS